MILAESSALTYVAYSVVGVIVGGGIGFLIGNAKNRPVLGVVLGVVLGCIGWLIVALIPRKEPG